MENEKRMIEIVPTLIESIYGNAKLLYDHETKEFKSACEAEEWSELNGVKIKIRHKAGSFIGDNLGNKNGHRDDSGLLFPDEKMHLKNDRRNLKCYLDKKA